MELAIVAKGTLSDVPAPAVYLHSRPLCLLLLHLYQPLSSGPPHRYSLSEMKFSPPLCFIYTFVFFSVMSMYVYISYDAFKSILRSRRYHRCHNIYINPQKAFKTAVLGLSLPLALLVPEKYIFIPNLVSNELTDALRD